MRMLLILGNIFVISYIISHTSAFWYTCKFSNQTYFHSYFPISLQLSFHWKLNFFSFLRTRCRLTLNFFIYSELPSPTPNSSLLHRSASVNFKCRTLPSPSDSTHIFPPCTSTIRRHEGKSHARTFYIGNQFLKQTKVVSIEDEERCRCHYRE